MNHAYIEPGFEGILGYKEICSQVISIDYIDKSYSNRMNHAYIEPGLEGMLGYKEICSQVTSIDYIDNHTAI